MCASESCFHPASHHHHHLPFDRHGTPARVLCPTPLQPGHVISRIMHVHVYRRITPSFCQCQFALVVVSSLICFSSILSYILSVPFLLSSYLFQIRIHRFVFFPRSGLLLALASSATPGPLRLAMPLSPSLRLDHLLSRNPRSAQCIYIPPSKLTYLTPSAFLFVSPPCSRIHHNS